MHFTRFPDEILELQQELMNGHHNSLIQEMNQLGYTQLSDGIVHIATHCGVLVEGTYTYEDKLALCRRLAKELVEKREPPGVIHVYGTSSPPVQ